MKKAAIISLAGLLIISCVPGASRGGRGLITLRLEHGGRTRECLVHVPSGAPSGLRPLLFVLHGGSGTARGMIGLTGNRFNELADSAGFYAVYPSGLGKSWNDLRDDASGYAHREGIDDTGFIAALIDRLAADYPVDANRVFATGISNGGFMCYRLACELSGKIRAVAAVAATNPVGLNGRCRPQRGVSVMIINGTDDPIVPYNGGTVTLLGSSRGRVVSTDDTVSGWVRIDGCPGKRESRDLPDLDPADRTRVHVDTYGPCAGGTRVVLYRVQGGGHTWPGGYQYLPAKFIGRTSRDIDACNEIWNFFNGIR
ncbi:MAG TPA: PHB depolymerase family esterase [Spirochaetota bacterium]|nr:PHB depolymerase family esterase [Spirochaetota bacterium]HPG49794.1 PHB depolymerase family esterase [Spirochaetota bacterium]HPN11222.1 PHB depolymerase family esterase [Spirochaetota bacterium]HQL83244.1 PHB depolymerase family esterase [Spirochaetota bacterium]